MHLIAHLPLFASICVRFASSSFVRRASRTHSPIRMQIYIISELFISPYSRSIRRVITPQLWVSTKLSISFLVRFRSSCTFIKKRYYIHVILRLIIMAGSIDILSSLSDRFQPILVLVGKQWAHHDIVIELLWNILDNSISWEESDHFRFKWVICNFGAIQTRFDCLLFFSQWLKWNYVNFI